MVDAEIAHLVQAAKNELSLDGHMDELGPFALDDYNRYIEEKRILADFVDSGDSTDPNTSIPIPDEWRKELDLMGDARKTLCNNARVELEGRVRHAEERLRAEQASLEKVIAALEDVKEAQESAEAAEQIGSSLLKLKDIAEVIREPEHMYDLLKERITGSPDDIIEAGIRNLGQYYEQVTLASHGFSSFEEMANFARASVNNVMIAGEDLGSVLHLYNMAKHDYEIPVP